MKDKRTFLFYDLETFGIHPQVDRIAQFAAIRTDENFNVISEPLVLYCKLTEDYLPEIEACLVHGITPQEANEKGLTEYQFAKRIHEEFSVPNTCVVGYNNIRFDDEFIRNLFYRNFFDPYYREWANGNSRWDIIDVVRVIHDLRPEGINWPINDEGKPSFKLEDLTKANNLSHEDAHDALSDVKATIALVRLIKEAQPKIFDFFYRHRNKQQILKLIYRNSENMFIHTSRMFTTEVGCSTIMTPLMRHPKNSNCVLAYDLAWSPNQLLSLSVTQIEKRLFEKDIPVEKRIHIKGIHINKCPVIAPLEVLEPETIKRLKIDINKFKENLSELELNKEAIREKLNKIYSREPEIDINMVDPERQIYSGGFFDDKDKSKFEDIHKASPKDLLKMNIEFVDERLNMLLWRFVCRNYPEVLSDADKKKWESFCEDRLLNPLIEEKSDIFAFKEQLEVKFSQLLSDRDKKVINSLLEYVKELEKVIN